MNPTTPLHQCGDTPASKIPGAVQLGFLQVRPHVGANDPLRSFVVVYSRHGMSRTPSLAIAGVVTATFLTGCSPSSQASNAGCPASPMVNFAHTAPDYGFGAGPAYLSGQTSWYSGGQAAILMVDSTYSGPMLVRASRFGGGGASQIALVGETLPPSAFAAEAAKERQHSVTLVSAVDATGGGLQLQAAPSSSFWRAWLGRLSTDGPGCFALQVRGTGFTEVIVFAVQAGAAPPG